MRRFLIAIMALMCFAPTAFGQRTPPEPIGRSGRPVATGVGPLNR